VGLIVTFIVVMAVTIAGMIMALSVEFIGALDATGAIGMLVVGGVFTLVAGGTTAAIGNGILRNPATHAGVLRFLNVLSVLFLLPAAALIGSYAVYGINNSEQVTGIAASVAAFIAMRLHIAIGHRLVSAYIREPAVDEAIRKVVMSTAGTGANASMADLNRMYQSNDAKGLVEVIFAHNPTMRVMAMAFLQKMNSVHPFDPPALSYLSQRMGSKDRLESHSSALTLACLGMSVCLPVIEDALLQGSDFSREQIMGALKYVNDPKVSEMLKRVEGQQRASSKLGTKKGPTQG